MKRTKIAAVLGITTPFLAFACILIAIANHPQFSWTNNALSDLGIIPGITELIFNFGLVISGILALIFSVLGLFNYAGKRLVGKIGAATFSAATITLIAIGVFNENFSKTHTAVSVAFFVSIPISMLIMTAGFVLEERFGMAILTLLIAIIAAAPWVILLVYRYVSGVAIPETVSGLAVSAWAIIVCSKILREKN